MPVKIECLICKKIFFVSPSAKKRGAKFCSNKCMAEYYSIMRRNENNPAWAKKNIYTCKCCGKTYRRLASGKKHGKYKFCSKECSKIYRHGENSSNWKGGKIISECPICGKIIKFFPSHKNKINKFCSRKCYNIWQFSEHNRGENNPAWKGGKTPERKLLYNRPEYKIWRVSVFERDGYRCLICGKVGGVINAHHIKNWRDYPELRYSVDNGMTMCEECHYLVNREFPLFSIKKYKKGALK